MKNKLFKTMLSICISVSMLIGINITCKASTLLPNTKPPTQSELNKLGNMTYDELMKVAVPMPESSMYRSIDKYAGNVIFVPYDQVPLDGRIYYYTYTDKLSGKWEVFTKSINIQPVSNGYVRFETYKWNFLNGKKHYNGHGGGDSYHEGLYTALTGKDILGNPIKNNDKMKKMKKVISNSSGRTYNEQRLDTITKVANNQWVIDNVIISTEKDYADSLSGVTLASYLNAPILYVNSKNDNLMYDYIRKNVGRNGGTVYILGGNGAVGTKVETKLKNMGYKNLVRLGGKNRYDTNSIINKKLNVKKGTPVVIASGENYPDALSISSIAAIKNYPVILTSKNKLTQQAETMLKNIEPSKVYVIGGTGVIANNTVNDIKNVTKKAPVRIWGNNRYETSLKVAQYFNISSDTIMLASGNDFRYALAGSVLAAKNNSPVLLLGRNIDKQKNYIEESNYNNIVILGDTNSISNDTENALFK